MARIFFSGLCFLVLTGCSSSYGIQKSYAFTRTLTAGNIPVDQDNRPLNKGVQKVHLLYIETAADVAKPQWDTAWVNGAAHLINPLKITQEVRLGKVKDSEKEVSISAQPGNVLWQLMLVPVLQIVSRKPEVESSLPADVLLSGVWKNKKATYSIKNQQELETIYGE